MVLRYWWRSIRFLAFESLRSWPVRFALLAPAFLAMGAFALSKATRAPRGMRDALLPVFTRVVAESVSWGVLFTVAVALSLSVFKRDTTSGARTLLEMQGCAAHYGFVRAAATSLVLLGVGVVGTTLQWLALGWTRGALPDAALATYLQSAIAAVVFGVLATASMGGRGPRGAYLVYLVALAVPEWLQPFSERHVPVQLTTLPRLLHAASWVWWDALTGLQALGLLGLCMALATLVLWRQSKRLVRQS